MFFCETGRPSRVDAMESYVRGLMASSAEQKAKFFTQAARLDDHFSQPNYELGRMLFAKKDYHNAITVAGARYPRRFALYGSDVSAGHLPVL